MKRYTPLNENYFTQTQHLLSTQINDVLTNVFNEYYSNFDIYWKNDSLLHKEIELKNRNKEQYILKVIKNRSDYTFHMTGFDDNNNQYDYSQNIIATVKNITHFLVRDFYHNGIV